jgi:hypothetical protein
LHQLTFAIGSAEHQARLDDVGENQHSKCMLIEVGRDRVSFTK